MAKSKDSDQSEGHIDTDDEQTGKKRADSPDIHQLIQGKIPKLGIPNQPRNSVDDCAQNSLLFAGI